MMTRDADKKEVKCSCFVWMTWFPKTIFSEKLTEQLIETLFMT